jgi:hypothetical protein
MPFLGGGSKSQEAEPISITILVQPKANLPQKAWEVEVSPSRTVKDLKESVNVDYFCHPDVMRICASKGHGDAGFKDSHKIKDLPETDDGSGDKIVYLQAVKGKEDELMDAVLDWAFRGEIIDEYEAEGCVYKPKDGAHHAAIGKPREPHIRMQSTSSYGFSMGHETSLSSRMSRPVRALRPSSIAATIRNRRPHVPRASFAVVGDKAVMQEPPPPIIDRMPFNVFVGVVCVLNVFVIGLEADYTCWGTAKSCKPADRMSWYAMDCIFAMLFAVEVVIRIVVMGAGDFFLGDPQKNLTGFNLPNCIDFLIISLRFLDTFIFDQMEIDTKIKVISCFRIMRLANIARLMRLVRSVRELWLVIAGLGQLAKTVMWVMILLVLIFWVCGIGFTIIIGHSDETFDYERSHWGGHYFDTVPKSVFSLLQTMTLAKWSSVMFRPVFEEYPAIFVLIIPFLCVTTVGLLNIIVGVVVETTLTSAANNAEKEGKELAKTHEKVMDSLKMVFEEADTDGGGTLDREELRKSLKKSHVRDRLRVLDIPVADLDQLFDVLDEAKIGEIQTDHFFRGCSRLRGPALSCDLHRMSVDFSRYISWTDSLVSKTGTMNARLSSLLSDMESVDRDIIKGDTDEFDPVLGNRRARSIARSQKHKEDNERTQQGRSNSKGTEGSRKSSRKNSLMASTLASSVSAIGLPEH